MVKNINLEEVTVKHLQAKGTCVVQHPEFEGTGEG